MAGMVLGSSSRRGDFYYEVGDTLLCSVAPFPYISGALAMAFEKEFEFAFLPSLEEAEKLEFQERVQTGFHMAMRSGLDAFFGVASVLAKIGEQFREGTSNTGFSTDMLHPRVLARIVRALIRSRLAGRKHLLPKDLWDVKGVATGGMDTSIFRDQIERDWGVSAVEAYAATDALGFLAVQSWNTKGMTFFPDVNFLEFIPEEQSIKSREDPALQPATLLLDELEAGKRYELVLTNLLGGIFVRYRIGDLIQIDSLQDEEIGVFLPQMSFYSRCDDVVDLAGFTRLTEKDIWQALESAGIDYVDWSARKQYSDRKPIVHLYVELNGDTDSEDVKLGVHAQLREIHRPYADLEDMLGMDPLEVTILPAGAYARYYQQKLAEGADLAHLKPPRMGATDQVIEELLA
jgi:hypothetical protein